MNLWCFVFIWGEDVQLPQKYSRYCVNVHHLSAVLVLEQLVIMISVWLLSLFLVRLITVGMKRGNWIVLSFNEFIAFWGILHI